MNAGTAFVAGFFAGAAALGYLQLLIQRDERKHARRTRRDLPRDLTRL